MEQSAIISGIINIKVGTLIAGLLGALITMLRKSQGSLQARLVGYITALATVLYLLPFLTWIVEWKFGFILHDSAEHLFAFILGMTAQRLTENFIDDPMGSLYLWAANFKKAKRVIWNNEALSISIEPNEKILTNDEKVEDGK